MSLVMWVYGTYHFKRKHVGFRPDICLACGNEAVAIEHRSFDVGHFYYLPLLPLGFRRHWHCSACGQDPRSERTSQAMKVLGILGCLFFGVMGWLQAAQGEDTTIVWVMRIGFPLVAAGLVASMRQRTRQDATLVQRLRRLAPLGDACPVCRGRLRAGAPRACTNCGAQERRAPELVAA